MFLFVETRRLSETHVGLSRDGDPIIRYVPGPALEVLYRRFDRSDVDWVGTPLSPSEVRQFESSYRRFGCYRRLHIYLALDRESNHDTLPKIFVLGSIIFSTSSRVSKLAVYNGYLSR